MRTLRIALTLGLVLAASLARAQSDDEPAPLAMSEPIGCRTIKGYQDYVELEEPALTKNEKLLLYVRPRNHTFEKRDDHYIVHLTEDVNIRKKGQKKVIWGRKKALDYQAESEGPPVHLYLGTTIGLKGFQPGMYEAEIILYDRLREGAWTSDTYEFRVVPAKP